MLLFTEEEIAVVTSIVGEHFDMTFGSPKDCREIDFEGNVLMKEEEGYRVYNWDYSEVYYEGSLENCAKYIIWGM
jgi:hypothetical protein